MCPAAGLNPLRVGPEDPSASEAGELVSSVGIAHQAKALITATGKQMPKQLRLAAQRFEHVERSKALDEGEVFAQVIATIGADNLESILSARVKGSKTNPLDSAVIALYETPTGRTGRCAVDYNEHSFPKSFKAYDDALKQGKIELPSEYAGNEELHAKLEEIRTENARLANENDELREGTPPAEAAEVELPEGVEAGDPGYPVDEEGELIALPDEVRSDLIAAAQEPASEEVELPDGVEPGDPGYPVGDDGELLTLPGEVRQQLIDAAGPTDVVEPHPLNVNEVELPEGNADQLVAAMAYYATPVVAALSVRGSAKATREAAEAELGTRPDRPEIAES